MFGRRYFAGAFFAPRVYGGGSAAAVTGAFFGQRFFGSVFFAPRYFGGTGGTAQATGYVPNTNLYLGIGSDLSIRLGPPRMPFWTTAARPAAPLDGVYGYNTTTGAIEVWNGSAWV